MTLAVSASIHFSDFSDGKHLLHFGHPEQLLNTRADTGDTQSNSPRSTAHRESDQHAEAKRIHVGNRCDVKDLFRRQRTVLRRFEDVPKGLWRQGVYISRVVNGPDNRNTVPSIRLSTRSMVNGCEGVLCGNEDSYQLQPPLRRPGSSSLHRSPFQEYADRRLFCTLNFALLYVGKGVRGDFEEIHRFIMRGRSGPGIVTSREYRA